jgi:uncharacterized membrane protein YhaH (DUF805 family)
MTEAGQPAPGWYPDPSGAPRYRYWDGELWTEHYHGDAATTGVLLPTPTPFQYWKTAMLEKGLRFEGRARQGEYWWTYLINLAIFVGLLIVGAIVGGGAILIAVLFPLVAFIPNLGVAVRRLHDTNKSGWWLLLVLAPFGGIILLVLLAIEGDRGPNQYGPSPLYDS